MAHGQEHEKELGGSGELLPHLRSGWRFGGVAVPRGFICSRNPGYLLALDDDRPLLFETLSVSSGLISHRQPPSLSTRRLFPCANELNACSGSGFGHMLTDPRQSEGDQRSVLVSPTSQTSVLDSDMTARALAGLLSDRRYILLFQADRPAPPACAPAETCRETRRRSSHRGSHSHGRALSRLGTQAGPGCPRARCKSPVRSKLGGFSQIWSNRSERGTGRTAFRPPPFSLASSQSPSTTAASGAAHLSRPQSCRRRPRLITRSCHPPNQ